LSNLVSKRFQFEAVVLAAVCRELEALIGSKVQAVRQPNELTVVFEMHGRGSTVHLLLCSHAEFYRVHLVSRKPAIPLEPPRFCAALRAHLDGRVLEKVTMAAGDRVLVLDFQDRRVIVELMGKHSNILLLDENNLVLSAAQWVGSSKSKRPIQPNQPYVLPPVLGDGEDISSFKDFALVVAHTTPRQTVASLSLDPGFSLRWGAYPFDMAHVAPDWQPRASMSVALESFYEPFVQRFELEQRVRSLSAVLERVIASREVALQGLYEARDQGGRAAKWQLYGDLLLTYGNTILPGSDQADLFDYEGQPCPVKLDPELDAKSNALKYFEKAKKAKGRLPMTVEQIGRLEADKARLEEALFDLLEAKQLTDVDAVEALAKSKRWLNAQPLPVARKEDRPYEGHRIREILGPQNHKILYGETATANDYLTMRLGKGNDYWLHIRGQTSAHVLVQTLGQPDKVSRETLMFAAKIAVLNSNQKHASHVPVDYTLKKYVRKPKGSPVGTVYYTQEKTLHVD
jgi:predicted ribosome quality control (RQC) complex YloA/Tae2 family protein